MAEPLCPFMDRQMKYGQTIRSPVNIFNRPVKNVPQIDLAIVCKISFISKQNISKEIIIILKLINCRLAEFDTRLKSFPRRSWCSDRSYRRDLWQFRIRINTWFQSLALVRAWMTTCSIPTSLCQQLSTDFCRLYETTEYFHQDIFHCTPSLSLHFFYIHRKRELCKLFLIILRLQRTLKPVSSITLNWT